MAFPPHALSPALASVEAALGLRRQALHCFCTLGVHDKEVLREKGVHLLCPLDRVQGDVLGVAVQGDELAAEGEAMDVVVEEVEDGEEFAVGTFCR